MRYAFVLLILWAQVAMAQRPQRSPVPASWKEIYRGQGKINQLFVRDGWLFWCEATVVPGTEDHRAQTLDVKLYRRRLDDHDAKPEFIAAAWETGGLPGMHPGPEGFLLWDSRGHNAQLSIPGTKPRRMLLDPDNHAVTPQRLMRRGIIGHRQHGNDPAELVWRGFSEDHTLARETTVIASPRKLPEGKIPEGNPRLLSINWNGQLLADDDTLVWAGQLPRGKQYVLWMTGVWNFKEQKEAWLLPGTPLLLTATHVYSIAPYNGPKSPWIVRRRVADGQHAEGWHDEGSPRILHASHDELLVLVFSDRGSDLVRRYDLKQGKRIDLDLGWRGSGWHILVPTLSKVLMTPDLGGGPIIVDEKRQRFMVALERTIYSIPFKPIGAETDVEVKWTPYEEIPY